MRSRTLHALFLAAACLAPDAAPSAQLAVPELLARMRAAAGPAAEEGVGDIALTGRLEQGALAFDLRILLRRAPFAYREELIWLAPAGVADAVPPPGIARHAVYVSNGVRGWNLADEVGPAGAMTSLPAVQLLDNAHLFRLLCDPQLVVADALHEPARIVTEIVQPSRTDVEALFLVWRHGTAWSALVERDTGRLLKLLDSTAITGRWYRLRDWRPVGGGLVFPSRIEEGIGETVGIVITITSARTGLTLGDESFPDDPEQPLADVADIAPLILAAHPVPGGGSVVLPEGALYGQGGTALQVWTLFDTGCSSAYVHPDLANQMGLVQIGAESGQGAAGGGVSTIRWIDRFVLGRRTLLQMPAGSAQIPPLNELPAGHPPGLIFGGPRLMELAPVLDLRGHRLLARGRTTTGGVRPLSDIAGRPTLLLPLGDAHVRPLVEASIGGKSFTALLDTGLPLALRLSRPDLRRLGLPDDDAAWRARGALPYVVGGAYGHAREELLVRLEQDLHLGPVTLRRPWIALMSTELQGSGERYEQRSQVGMGALMAFEQVGFDWPARRLEIVAPDALLMTGEAAAQAVVPAPGTYLGFVLSPPDAGATTRPHDLAFVRAVTPGTPAARAGLQAGDRLAEIGGFRCDGLAPMELWGRLDVPEGGAVELQVLRDGAAGPVRVRIEG